jgi:hypothetical protein
MPIPQSTVTVTTVFYNGLGRGWRSESYGCVECDFADTSVRKYAGSQASAFAAIAPWGALVLRTDTPFSAQALLDLLVRGSGENAEYAKLQGEGMPLLGD